LRQFERAEQAISGRRLAGIRDHSVRVRVGGLCTTTIAFVVIVVAGSVSPSGVRERYGRVDGDVHDARSFEEFFLGRCERVSDQEGIARLCGAEVEICV
jgi:hypothetical protein